MAFYFIFGARPSWSSLQVQLNFYNFFSLFCTTSSRRLCVLDYGEFPNVSKNCICCVVGSRSLKSSHGDSRVKYFYEFEMNLENEFFLKLLFKCLVNWLIYEKRSMPGRNSILKIFNIIEWILESFV